MTRPVVIVDPLSAGIELAPAFRARGIPAIAVTIENKEWPEFGSKIQEADFIEIIADQAGIANLLKPYNPLAIIPGTEEGISLAEHLSSILTPQLAHDAKKSSFRGHKAFMQMALSNAGVPALKTVHTDSEIAAEKWIQEAGLKFEPLIIKPPRSSGSEMVFHIPAGGDWKSAFRHILQTPSSVSGKKSETAVIQEQATGTEFAVGTVSVDGEHFLVHLIRYHKSATGDRATVFDYVEFIPYEKSALGELFEYVKSSLDALGVRWGASHTEVMLTANGPRLIETSARLIGGPVVEFARAATGSSQVDKLVEIYVDGRVRERNFSFRKTVVPVFLKAVKAGVVSNLEVFDSARQLPSFSSQHVWIKNGSFAPETVDYLTSIGIIALAGSRDQIFSDYEKIRAMEANLRFEPAVIEPD